MKIKIIITFASETPNPPSKKKVFWQIDQFLSSFEKSEFFPFLKKAKTN